MDPLLAMGVNLPCLMGSCPNFLRPTCPYTGCRLSCFTGSKAPRSKLLPATALICILDNYQPDWISDGAHFSGRIAAQFPLRWFLPDGTSTLHPHRVPFQNHAQLLPLFARNSARSWSTSLFPAGLSCRPYATFAVCVDGYLMSFNIFSGSYFTPVVSIL